MLIKKIGKLAASVVLTMMTLNMVLVPNAFALNANGSGNGTGNKPLGFNGYKYVSNSEIDLYFDSQLSQSEITAGQFTVAPDGGGTAVSVTNAVPTFGAGDSGVTTSNMTKGTTVALTVSTLAYNTLYDVTINGATITSGNATTGWGITFGNYRTRNPFEFYMLTPSSAGVYDSTKNVNVAYTVTTSGVSYEDNLAVICDRPFQLQLLASQLV